MSVLHRQTQEVPNIYEIKAKRVRRSAASSTESLIQGVTSSLRIIWEDEDPQAVLDALGTDCKELFELTTSTIEFLTVELTGKRDSDLAEVLSLAAKVQPHTVNEDGTVTID